MIATNEIYRLALTANDQIPTIFSESAVKKISHGLSSRRPEEREKSHILRYGICALLREGKVTISAPTPESYADELAEWLMKNKTTSYDVYTRFREISMQIDESFAPLMAVFIGNLFDYYHVLEFSKLSTYFPLTKKPTTTSITAYWRDALAEALSLNSKTIIVNKNTATAQVMRTNLDDLIEILYRHKKIITTAFPYLSQHPNFNAAWKIFLQDTVLNTQGWAKYTVTANNNLSLSCLETKLAAREQQRPEVIPARISRSCNHPG